MKAPSNSETSIRTRAENLGYSIHECMSFEGCYFIVDMSTSLVIAGAQDFLAWEDVVRWVLNADGAQTLQ